jgi:hypothetical protein
VVRQPNGIGRMCPCDERPDRRPPAQRSITVCIACIGVKIRGNVIPSECSQAQMAATQPRRSARPADQTSATAQINQTRGPQRAVRSALSGVNIERGWVSNDPLIGD